MKITVLAGGLSPERNVSLCSGALIAASLIRSGHKVAYADVYLGVPNVSDIDSLFTDTPPQIPTIGKEEPDLDALRRQYGNRLIGENILELCRRSDAVFLALHGGMGENGQLQATLDNFDIPFYTGSSYSASLFAMDKEISKRIMSGDGILVPPGIVICAAQENAETEILAKVGLPCVIKPCSCGSSVGVSIVYDADGLRNALKSAAVFEDRIIAEKLIKGREFSVGILDGRSLPAIEIIPKTGFYDYKNKYTDGMTEEICPAELTEAEAQAASELALEVFKSLRLGGYGRIDMILSREDGRFYCLEANTLPGMTPASLLPREAKAAGISYDELCNIIVETAVRKRTE